VVWTSAALVTAYLLDRIYDVPVRRLLSNWRRYADRTKPVS
jgi:hypothetical protein